MASSDGKIKFSLFSKPKGPLGKSPAANFIPKKHDDREKIDFIENNTIKTTGKQQEEAPKLLVIPLPKPNKPVIPVVPPANAGQSKQPNPQEACAPDGGETLEQRAAREIVEQTADAIVKKEQAANFVVPLRAELRLEDSARQSNLDDYESVPIEQFGMAMLRGMGFTGDPTSESDKLTPGPELRPKGLGLGADKTIKGTVGTGNNRSAAPDENLVMKCGAPVKIAMGKLQGKYGLNGTPEHIVLLDWQVARYCSPILDLAYFIFCCTDEEFRRRHYDEMMSIYYNSLATLLEKLGHNPQEVFPRTAFLRQLRQYGRFGLMLAVFLVPMMCTRNEDLPDMNATAEMFRDTDNVDIAIYTKHTNQSAYRKRMRAVIRDTVRYGYI